MAGYKLATYQSADGPRAGLVVDDKVFDAAKLDRQAGLCDRARHPQRLEQGAGRAEGGRRQGRQEQGQGLPLAKAKLLAPVLYPSAIYCAGANYQDHANEMARAHGQRAAAARPAHARARILAFHQGLARDLQSRRDRQDLHLFEEDGLGGRAGRGDRQDRPRTCPMDKALSYVAGYTIANDLSARDRGRRPHIPDTFAVQGRLGGAQELRRLLPARALDRAGERHQGPAESRHQAVGERRPEAGFQHQPDDLQSRRADRAPVVAADAASRRPDPDRHAGRASAPAAANSSRPATRSSSGSRRSARSATRWPDAAAQARRPGISAASRMPHRHTTIRRVSATPAMQFRECRAIRR